MRGRKPLPTNLKLLYGNPGKRKIPKGEPKPKVEKLACPEALKGREARAEWKRLAPELHANGLLTKIDRTALFRYCEAWGLYRKALTEIDKTPVIKAANGTLMPSPWIAIRNKTFDQMCKVEAEFGMTPSSRSRVVANPPAEGDDGFEELMFGKTT